MKLKIVEVKPGTKSGTYWAVAEGGIKYYSKASGIEQAGGKTIEADLGQFAGKQGPVNTIESFSISVSQPAAEQNNGQPYWWPSVSNVWAHAIQSGLIKEPSDLKQWALAVQAAAEERQEDDDIPY